MGEVYLVDDETLQDLDELENNGVNYTRKVIPVAHSDDPEVLLHVFAYLKCNYTPDLVSKDYFADYQDRRYVLRHQRPAPLAPPPKRPA